MPQITQISLLDALLISLLCIAIVFIVLVFLNFIIVLMGKIAGRKSAVPAPAAAAAAPAPAPKAAAPAAPVSTAAMDADDDMGEVIAAISAVLLTQYGMSSLPKLKVRPLTGSNAWAAASKLENVKSMDGGTY